MNIPDDPYVEFITRKRWKLVEAVWLLHGIFMQTKKEYGTRMELFYGQATNEMFDNALKAGQLSEDYIDRMLAHDVKEETTCIRIENWETLPSDWHMQPYDPETFELKEPDHEAVKTEESVRKFWHMINTRADLTKCEVAYVDANDKWYALSPESQWNAEYLLDFAQKLGMDVDWLVEDIRKHNSAPTPQAISLATERTNMHIQVTGVEAKGEVGEIPKPEHKFQVGTPIAPIPKLIAVWLEVVRDNGESWPENQADRFLTWLAETKPNTPYIEIEEITNLHIKFWNLNAAGEKKDKVVQTYDKNNINGRIKVLTQTH